jgi:hypothetical protein
VAAWTGWEADVLARLGAGDTSENILFLDTWHTYEESTCKNNPLNTTQAWPLSTRCNSAGVRSYRIPSDGAKATAATLLNGRYSDVVAALKSGNPFAYAAPSQVAAQVTTWGTPLFAAWYTEHTGTPQAGAVSGQTGATATASGHRGYADLRNSVARHLPTQLLASRRATSAALQVLAHGHKVKAGRR